MALVILLGLLHMVCLKQPILGNPIFVPVDQFELNCNHSPDTLPSSGHKLFLQNSSISRYEREELNTITVARASIDGPVNPNIPQLSACIFYNQSTYTFSVSEGMKFVRLHFYPTSYSGLNILKALFSVSVAPYTLLTTSESSYTLDSDYSIKEFCINVKSSILNITFTPSKAFPDSYAFVNKIEVISMALNLYVRDVPVTVIGHPFKSLVIGNSTALENVYRLNIGGDSIAAESDTGMDRVWLDDSGYLLDIDGMYLVGGASDSKVDIKYSTAVPAYVAPQEVYSTARTREVPIKWSFVLDVGFSYLFRLHFCEIRKRVYPRVFQILIYINNETAGYIDVVHWAGGVGVPVYRDYAFNLSKKQQLDQQCNMIFQLGNTTGWFDPPILNGLEIFKLSDSSNNLSGPYPFENRLPIKLLHGSGENRPKLVIIPFSLFGGMCVVSILCYIFLHLPMKWSAPWQRKGTMQWASSDNYQYFSLAEVKKATKNFSDANFISNGGFGKVYKGHIIDGTRTKVVAVKRGSLTSCQGFHEFQTEITVLSKLRHRHLVSLIGYCTDDNEMILVYEFMAGGTLRDHLYNSKKTALQWKQRLEICIGAARGLQYLHSGAKRVIIHRDVKTTNILLDHRWVAKVSDFGLSKDCPDMSHTHGITTLVKGSFGYMDPEYYRRQKLTEKSDVYSFGVVLFEVLCARPAVLRVVAEEEIEQVSLAEWVLHCQRMGTLDQIIDPCLRGKIDPLSFKTFTEIATRCLESRGNERPSMCDVLWNLELAWQQQQEQDRQQPREPTEEIQENSCSAAFSVGFKNSDPTPGAEFSEIMVPVGR